LAFGFSTHGDPILKAFLSKRTFINADESLKAVFNGKKQVSMFEMTKLVSGHLKK